MLAERCIYLGTAVLLVLFVRLDTLENDGDEGKLAMYGFSALFFLLGLFLPLLKALWGTGVGKLLLLPVQLFTVWYFAFVGAIALCGRCCRAGQGLSYMIVLGTSLRGKEPSRLLEGRLLAARSYWSGNPQVRMVLSGGQVRAEEIPEAEAMAGWMLSHGVSGKVFCREVQSATTYQNFVNSLPLLKELGFTEAETLAVATDGFHFLRCCWLARKAGIRHVRLVPSVNGSLHCMGWFFREVMVFVKLRMDGIK